MKKIVRNWYCLKCKATNKFAHEATLRQYFLVMKSSMTNQECQHFLLLNNKHEATKIQRNQLLIQTGQARPRKYMLRPPENGKGQLDSRREQLE